LCPVARLLGARAVQGSLVVAAQEVEFAASPEDLVRGTIAAEVPELFFCPDLEGYGWCFRKGDYLNVGLGRTQREHLSSHVAQFVEFLRARKIVADVPARFTAPIAVSADAAVLCDDAVLLVGDAAAGLSAKRREFVRRSNQGCWRRHRGRRPVRG
jgi:flavin-dependent dehydrogenase